MSSLLMLLGIVLVAAGFGATAQRRAWAAHREAAIAAALPDVTDLFIAVLGAGGTIGQAVRLVAERGPAIIRPTFDDALRHSQAGRTMSQGLNEIAPALGAGFRPLLAALVSAERDGAPVADLVLRLGEEGRTARRHLAEQRNRRLPVQLLFPLVCCSLPAVIVGSVVPLALMALGRIDF